MLILDTRVQLTLSTCAMLRMALGSRIILVPRAAILYGWFSLSDGVGVVIRSVQLMI